MKVLLLILFTGIIFTGCTKEEKTLDSGLISGMDPRMCMCCGGWFVEINDTIRRFDRVPADCTIDFTTVTYPLKVKLDWKKKDTLCLGDEIVVGKLLLDL